MPRRDVVLTGLIAFGAGVAVGANWGKLRKKIGPVIEKLGLQMADLGDFLSANGMEEFFSEATEVETKATRPRTKRRAKTKAGRPEAEFATPSSRRNGRQINFPGIPSVPARRKPSRRKPVITSEEEVPLANGTFGS